jgi:hypothetical protein
MFVKPLYMCFNYVIFQCSFVHLLLFLLQEEVKHKMPFFILAPLTRLKFRIGSTRCARAHRQHNGWSKIRNPS